MGIIKWLRSRLGNENGSRKDEEPLQPDDAGPEASQGKDASRAGSEQQAPWLEPDDPGNPFGVRLLNLMDNLKMLSTTTDPALAARAASWKAGAQRDVSIDIEAAPLACDLRYPAPSELPDGMIYLPEQMEDKWVLAYRDGCIAAARSWTGETMAVARAHHDGEVLKIDSIAFAASSGLDTFGDPVVAFDWLIRTHALESRVPLPISSDGANLLAQQPLTGFSVYGRHLFCAAVDYDLGEPKGRLHSDGDLMTAVTSGDLDRLRSVIAAGAPVNAPSRFNHGAPALLLCVYLHPEFVGPLVDAGADVNVATLQGATPLMAAAAGADPALIERLVAWGARLDAVDARGFAAVHVATQFGKVDALAALVDCGGNLQSITADGLTPLHIAAGTGKTNIVEWLIAQGIDPTTPSPLGSALEIAEKNGHDEVVQVLRRR
ncbi:MAG: ankyrin repeat domain-containing protein [Minicystis sp.]